jgi:Spherulation-specific family 4
MPKPVAFPPSAPRVGAALVLVLSLLAGGCSDNGSQAPNAGGAAGTRTNVPSAAGAAGEAAAGGETNEAAGAVSSASGTGSLGGTNLGGTTGALGGGAGSGGSPSAGSGGNGGGGTMGGQAMGGGGGQAPAGSGCIVPMYSYPDASAWTAIVQAKQAHAAVNVVAIVNPDSGPGTGVDGAFTTGIAKLVAAGIVPIGYISTNYTKRGQAAVKADIDTWRASYATVEGIFFDEQSNTPGDEAFYSAVSSYAKSKGFTLTVGNPGTGVPDSFLGSVDVMLSYESAGTPKLASLSQYAAHRDQFGIIPYAAAFDATYVRTAAQSVRYVYVTDDDLPDPWDTLPSYFDPLLGALAP